MFFFQHEVSVVVVVDNDTVFVVVVVVDVVDIVVVVDVVFDVDCVVVVLLCWFVDDLTADLSVVEGRVVVFELL